MEGRYVSPTSSTLSSREQIRRATPPERPTRPSSSVRFVRTSEPNIHIHGGPPDCVPLSTTSTASIVTTSAIAQPLPIPSSLLYDSSHPHKQSQATSNIIRRAQHSPLSAEGTLSPSIDRLSPLSSGAASETLEQVGHHTSGRDQGSTVSLGRTSGRQVIGRTKSIFKFLLGRDSLCGECQNLPFADWAHPGATETKTYLLSLTHILQWSKTCGFCGLLLSCVRHPEGGENDLFRDKHINEPLKSSVRLKDIKSFDEWVNIFAKRKFESLLLSIVGEAVWPFGYTGDQKEVTRTNSEARNLLDLAEKRALDVTRIVELLPDQNDLVQALAAAELGMDFIDTLHPEAAAVTTKIRAVTGHMSNIIKAGRQPLPCIFAIRAYPFEYGKGGVSVRVFAHGRKYRAPLKEISHFTLRSETSETPRLNGTQLWYGRKLKPQIDVKFFRECLKTCREHHHSTCGDFQWASEVDLLGSHDQWTFRLVDVESKMVVPKDFQQVVLSRTPYVALSYRWGDLSKDILMLTKHTKDALQQDGALHLPSKVGRTVADAMRVTQDMGCRYLWVDRLCVPQVPTDPDNIANIRNMGQIYGQALFTVVAAGSRDTDDGIQGLQERQVPEQKFGEIANKNSNFFVPITMKQNLELWESRAWTFQEKLLSRRMLVFAGDAESHYAVWRCRGAIWREDVNALDGDIKSLAFDWTELASYAHETTSSAAEMYGLMELQEDGSMRLFRKFAFDQYVGCVEDYFRRSIGISKDILRGYKGIMDVLGFENILNSQFFHGLPRRYIDLALLWQPHGKVCRRPGNIPSWCWGGWEAVLEDSSPTLKGSSQGPCVFYHKPFHVRADDHSLNQEYNRYGEERVRPKIRMFRRVPREGLTPIGFLAESWVYARSKKIPGWGYSETTSVPQVPANAIRHLDTALIS